MGIFGSFLGFVLGVVVVRAFMLDGAEEIGWRIFWSEVQRGNAGLGELSNVSGSATFLKCVVGGIVGAALGGFIGERMSTSPGQKVASDGSAAGTEDTKKCPYCAETVKNDAILCKHCGKDIPHEVSRSVA